MVVVEEIMPMYLKMDAAMKNGNRADIFHSVMIMFHTAHNMEYRIKRYRAEKRLDNV
jgi:hypothetical protein